MIQGNHNWVEVWLPETKGWQFVEYGGGPDDFDRGWLVADAARGIPGRKSAPRNRFHRGRQRLHAFVSANCNARGFSSLRTSSGQGLGFGRLISLTIRSSGLARVGCARLLCTAAPAA